MENAQQSESTIHSDDEITSRLESFLSAEEPQAQDQSAPPAEKATDEPAEQEVEQEAEGEGQEDAPSMSLTDLSKYLGIDETALDVDESGQLSLKTKVDGQEGKAKLADLITSYQLRAHLDNETRAVAEQRKAIQAQFAEMERAVQARAEQIETLANVAQNELMRQFQGIDWQTLRATDPAEYAALSHDFQVRQGQIAAVLQATQAQKQQNDAARQQEVMSSLENEARALPALIPEWSDSAIAERERGEIREWALKSGLPQNEVDAVSKAAHVAVMRKAMLYDRMQSTKAAVEKKVTAAPKLVKPGQAAPRNTQESTIKSIKANVRKSGGKDGIVEYLLATGKV